MRKISVSTLALCGVASVSALTNRFVSTSVGDVQGSDTLVFVSGYTGPGKSKGMYIYSLDASNGAMKLERSFGTEVVGEGPSYLAFSPCGRFCFAVNEPAAAVTAMKFDPSTLTVTRLNSQPSQGEDPCQVSVTDDGKFLAVANYTGGRSGK